MGDVLIKQEAFQLKSRVRKSDDRGSSDYAKDGRPGNPDRNTVHPLAYPISTALHFPQGFMERLRRHDPLAMEELARQARLQGYRGTYDVCRNWGGFNCKGARRRIALKNRQIDNMHRGLEIILRDFEV